MSEIRRKIVEQSGLFSEADIMPVPCNPDTLAMGYAFKDGASITPLTRYLDPQTWWKARATLLCLNTMPA